MAQAEAAGAVLVHWRHDIRRRRGAQVVAAVLPQKPTVSATRAPPEGVRPPADAPPAGSAVAVVPQRESRWQKQWQDMRSQARPRAPGAAVRPQRPLRGA
jgi:hypothetical protein